MLPIFAILLLLYFFDLTPLYSLLVVWVALLVAEYYLSSQSILFYGMLLFASPVFAYFVQAFGFSIRLWLSSVAAQCLSYADATATAVGNGIVWKGELFWVDDACIGIKMAGVGVVVGLAIMGFQAKYYRKEWRTWVVFITLALLPLLVIWGNLARLLSIVVLKAPSGSLGHELLGILALFIYVALPIYGLSYCLIRQKWACHAGNYTSSYRQSQSPLWLWIALLGMGALSLKQTFPQENRAMPDLRPPKSIVGNKSVERLASGIWKSVDDNGRLWYFKGPLKGYKSDHSPMVCWKGSGYKLSWIRVSQQEYQGELHKEEGRLHTRWWYQDVEAKTKTCQQWEWRIGSLLGREYWLVNVTEATGTP